jgi:putative transcriptional regulator
VRWVDGLTLALREAALADTAGKLLIASPRLQDSNFLQSVVYMIRHNEQGALGVVLNRPLGVPLDERLGDVLGWVPKRETMLYWGGPCEGALVALHDHMDLAEIPCGVGLYAASSPEALSELCEREHGKLRLYFGYSGWGEHQLERELEVGGWLLLPGSADDVFGDTDELWRSCVARVGREILSLGLPDGLGPKGLGPTAPELN